MAEQLIQDLFLNAAYNVFNYGLERLHPFLSRSLARNNQKTSKALRFMPDFVVQSTKTGQLFYMEVKYRANGCFAFDDRYNDYPYKNAWFVIVSPDRIQCLHYNRLAAGHQIRPETKYHLSSVRSFHIDKQLLQEYEEYAAVMFSGFQNQNEGRQSKELASERT